MPSEAQVTCPASGHLGRLVGSRGASRGRDTHEWSGRCAESTQQALRGRHMGGDSLLRIDGVVLVKAGQCRTCVGPSVRRCVAQCQQYRVERKRRAH